MNSNSKIKIDEFSFQLGMINCFVEMIACGVKKMAISPPLSPAHYEQIAPYSDEIVAGFGIKSYLEKSLMITMLQSSEFTTHKYSILYYKDEEYLDTYLKLKERQAKLIELHQYDNDAQKEISIAFMQLLSYPSDVIESKLTGTHSAPFLITDR